MSKKEVIKKPVKLEDKVEKPTRIEEIKLYTHKGIDVLVKIDFFKMKISLLENINSRFQAKKWVFADRELRYMDGWLLILEAMQFAIKSAKEDLEKDSKDFLKSYEENNIFSTGRNFNFKDVNDLIENISKANQC